ncbi:MAG TPA: glycosyltransferase family 9 protein [Candidatus Wallbacteria bacterium]|nr:glycosyltransferase family 9 protein [Candidatus Wallbacteria bacterium]
MFKNASVDLMVDERFSDLVVENPSLDGFILYKNTGRSFLEKLRYDINFLFMVRKRRYDVVIDFHGIPKTAWFSYFSGAGIRVGYDYKGRGRLYTHRMKPPEKFTVHSAINQIELLKYVPGEFVSKYNFPGRNDLSTFISADLAKKECEDFRESEKISGDENIFVYHISPSNDFKKWPAQNYSALINMIERHPALSAMKKTHVIIGTIADAEEFQRIKSSSKPLNGSIVSACGKLSLGALYNLAGRAKCYIGPDSGPLHIAAAGVCPVIGLFGPTNAETFGPLSKNFTAVCDMDLKCRPCDQKKCRPGDFRCIKKINVRDVFDAVLKSVIKNK